VNSSPKPAKAFLQLVRFEREPDNAEILNTIFRLVHLDLTRIGAAA
jgi:hypothetical protein